MPEAETKTESAETKTEETKETEGATPKATEAKTDDGAGTAMKAERDARKKAEAELKALKAEREAEQKKVLEETGNYKVIADGQAAELAALKSKMDEYETSIPALKEKSDRLEAILKKQLDARLASLQLSPAIVKLLDKMPTAEQLEWLTENAAEVATKASALPVDPVKTGGSKTEISDEEKRKRTRPVYVS